MLSKLTMRLPENATAQLVELLLLLLLLFLLLQLLCQPLCYRSAHKHRHTHPHKNNNNSCCCQILALAFGAFNQNCRKAAKGKFGNAYKIDMMHGQSSPEFLPISLCPHYPLPITHYPFAHSKFCLCGQRLFTKLANVVENLYRVYITHAIYERHQLRAHIIIDRMRKPDSI